MPARDVLAQIERIEMRRRVLGALFCSLLYASTVAAQLASQTALVGTVTDNTGAVLPGVQVVAVNTGTRDTYETVTNGDGYYNIQFVRTGTYEITATLSGFQTAKVTGIEVANNQVVRTNATLNPGGVVETVTVDARPPVLNTDSATISETIGARAIKDLPLINRNVWNLATITPGVVAAPQSDIGLSFRGAGQREIQNSLSLDGINASSNLLAATSMRPISEAVTEVQVQTGSTSAEYGSYLGVAINIVTKSGTNAPHGSIAEAYQGDSLDSRGYFDAAGTPKNPRKRNQFSFEADGPFMIPKLYDGRDKTFFMAAYEGIRSNASTTSFATVPTALMRTGNFSEVTSAIKNPFTGQNFTNNQIPSSMLSATALKLLEYYPAPNQPGTANNLRATRVVQDDADQLLLRGDQNLGNKVRVYARYNWFDTYTSNLEAVPVSGITQPRTNHNTLVAYTHTLKPNLLNDFRIGYHRIDFDTLNYFSINDISGAGSALNIPGFNADTAYNNPGIPSINITSFTGLGGGGTNWIQFDTTFQLSNVLAYNRGAHNLRAGFDLRRMATGRKAANDPRGRFDFTGNITGYSVADFMLGLPRTVINPTDQIQGHVGQWRNGFFANDVWQLSQNLTLSLGVRYEMNTPVQTYVGLASMLDESFERIIPTTFPSPGFEFTEANKKDWAPRLGATYRLGSKTVVRAGYGIYYNPNQMNSFTFLTNNPPVAAVSTFTSDPANPTLSFTSPTGVATVVVPDMISPTRHLPNARKDQYSFDLQHEIAEGTAVDVQYIGSHTKNLDRSFFNNTPQPGPGAVDPRRPSQNFKSRRIISNDLIADYDAVSFIVRKRMSAGLQVDGHYTWSKTRDEATHSNGGGQTMDNYDPMRDYGPSNWDIPHRFVASYIYDVPFLKNSSNPVLKYLVAGWQVAGVTTVQSGATVNVLIPTDVANTGINNQQRPNLVGSVPKLDCETSPTKTLINCFDPSAFAMPAAFTFGSAGRNILRGPKWVQTDVSFAKTVPIGGPIRLEVRADIFNLFNHANLAFTTNTTTFGAATFGSISQMAPGANMRQIQLGGRLLF
jgi:Carboxypeptidase regulatory-like domain/TonB dependent receptor-like, beta-barrel